MKTNDRSSLSSSVEIHNSFSKLMIIVRLLFIAALSLLVAGGAISLNGNSIGDNLVKAAYIIFTAILSAIIAMILHLRFQKSKLVPKSLIVRIRGTWFMHSYKILTWFAVPPRGYHRHPISHPTHRLRCSLCIPVSRHLEPPRRFRSGLCPHGSVARIYHYRHLCVSWFP